MIELRPDAPLAQLAFWSVMLVVWLVVRFRARKKRSSDD